MKHSANYILLSRYARLHTISLINQSECVTVDACGVHTTNVLHEILHHFYNCYASCPHRGSMHVSHVASLQLRAGIRRMAVVQAYGHSWSLNCVPGEDVGAHHG